MKAKVITHYEEDDTNCDGEYLGVEIFIDGDRVQSFNDEYHEYTKPAAAFIMGLELGVALNEDHIEVEYENVADGKWQYD